MTECLAAHAEQVFTGSGKNNSDAKYLLRRVKEMGREFGKQELWQKAKGRLQSAEVFDAALRELEEHGYVRKATIQTAGRPVVRIQANPAGDG